tara:strand:+ start:150 stop:266 length:117 start_codon:yes stop_codon:yes gene_type:complete
MMNIYIWAAKPAKQTAIVGDLNAAKEKRQFEKFLDQLD